MQWPAHKLQHLDGHHIQTMEGALPGLVANCTTAKASHPGSSTWQMRHPTSSCNTDNVGGGHWVAERTQVQAAGAAHNQTQMSWDCKSPQTSPQPCGIKGNQHGPSVYKGQPIQRHTWAHANPTAAICVRPQLRGTRRCSGQHTNCQHPDGHHIQTMGKVHCLAWWPTAEHLLPTNQAAAHGR